MASKKEKTKGITAGMVIGGILGAAAIIGIGALTLKETSDANKAIAESKKQQEDAKKRIQDAREERIKAECATKQVESGQRPVLP